MNLPKVVADLVKSQNDRDSVAYANCFAETATVVDEGNTYNGRTAIHNWIADANEKFNLVKKPLQFETNETESILSAEVSGNFEGSPVVLHYHFQFAGDQIQSLKITV